MLLVAEALKMVALRVMLQFCGLCVNISRTVCGCEVDAYCTLLVIKLTVLFGTKSKGNH